MFDSHGEETIGVFTAALDLTILWNRVARISAEHGGQAFITDGQHRVIAHPDPAVVLDGTSFVPPDGTGTGTGLSGESSVIASAAIVVGGQEFTLVAETPTREAFAPLRQLTWVTVGAIVLVALATVLVALGAVRRVLYPIERLGARAERVRTGDLDLSPAAPRGPIELQELDRTFDEMVAGFREREVMVAERDSQLRANNEQLERAAVEAQASAAAEHRTSMELARREQRLNAVLDTAADAIIGITARGAIQSFNHAAEEMFGYEAEQVVGESIEILMPHGTAREHQRSVDTYVETGQATTVVGQVRSDIARRSDGSEFPIQLSVSEVREGVGGGFTGIIRDMTAIKQAEYELAAQAEEARAFAVQARQAALAKSQFLATMSHEIRTPMNGVIGMTGLLFGTELTAEQHQYATAIHSSGQALLTLINDILDYSKIEAGKVEFEARPFSLRDTVYEVAELLAHRDDHDGIDLLVHYPIEVPDQVVGDPGRIRQLLLNLGSNAVKFTAEGQVEFSVEEMDARGDGTRQLRIAVADTGMGIPAERLDAIFEEFTQVDASTTRTHGGTGLGLSIVQDLIGRMDGSISVESVEGAGSTFTLELPFEIGEQADTEAPPAEVSSARVLLVGDNESTRALADRLTEWGIEHTAASGVPEVISTVLGAHERPFDLVIYDAAHARRAQIELEEIRTSCPEFVRSRLLLTTPIHQREAATEIADVAALITSPTPPARLLDALSAALGVAPATPVEVPTEPLALDRAPLVLVAEDNTVNQIVARKMLQNLGCRVDVVENGLEAVRAVAETDYELVFMDCQMPEMDGYEATKAIRRGAVRSDLPIVAMTANAMEGDRERCLEAGMDDYVAKPVTADALPTMLRRWLPATSEEQVA